MILSRLPFHIKFINMMAAEIDFRGRVSNIRAVLYRSFKREGTTPRDIPELIPRSTRSYFFPDSCLPADFEGQNLTV